MMRQKIMSFDDIVTKTIIDVIRNVFKDDTAEVILEYFKDHNSKKLDERLRIFTDDLPKILGTGSVIIEDLILETLYSKFESELKWKKDYRFEKYVIELGNKQGFK